MIWQTSRFSIDLERPKVMGIVNVTPDSFSDGGHHASAIAALRHCEQLLKDGADILDIGGESTRPGSPAVPLDEELARVVPLVREVVALGVPISVDTYKPAVMRAVLDLGADIVNDIWALRQPGALAVVAAHPQCGVCLMHMHRDPQTGGAEHCLARPARRRAGGGLSAAGGLVAQVVAGCCDWAGCRPAHGAQCGCCGAGGRPGSFGGACARCAGDGCSAGRVVGHAADGLKGQHVRYS